MERAPHRSLGRTTICCAAALHDARAICATVQESKKVITVGRKSCALSADLRDARSVFALSECVQTIMRDVCGPLPGSFADVVDVYIAPLIRSLHRARGHYRSRWSELCHTATRSASLHSSALSCFRAISEVRANITLWLMQ